MDIKIKAILVLVLLAITVYSNSLSGDFVYDDDYFVVKNINIRNLENIPSFFVNPQAVAFSELSQDVYRPITTISYALDYRISGLNTFFYHLINILFHALNSILVFLLLFAIFNDIFVAFFAALLFTVHPVQTEVVSWISGRSSLLFTFFYLLSFVLYVLYAKRKNILLFSLSVLLYILAVFSKEMAVTLPLVLIVYDFHFNNNDNFRKRFLRYLPYFIIAAFYILARFLVVNRLSQCDWLAGNAYNTFLTMMVVLSDYVKILITPVNLCVFYVTKVYQSFADLRVVISAFFLIILIASLPFIYRRSRRISFAIFFFFITLLPVLNIIPLRAFMAERFLYLPSVGFFIVISLLYERIYYFAIRSKFIILKTLFIALAVMLILGFGLRTMARNEDWKDDFLITQSILRIDPLNPWGLLSLGVAYASKGDFEAAVMPLKKSDALVKDYFAPKNVLGFCYLQLGRFDEAIKILREALKLKPYNLEALNSIGVSHAQSGKYEEALVYFKKALVVDPLFVNLYINIGTCYENMGKHEEAIREYEKVSSKTRAKYQSAISYIRIGDVYVKLKSYDKAVEYYQKALALCDSDMDELKKVINDRFEAVKVFEISTLENRK